MAEKATMAEAEYRVAVISSLILRGKTRRDIIQFSAKKWNIQEGQTDKYIARAKEQIHDEAQSTIEADTAKARARLEFLYDKAIGNEDYGLARVLNKDFIEFTGIKAPDKIDHTTKGESLNDVSKLSTEELLKRAGAVKTIESSN